MVIMSTSNRLGWSDYINRYEEASDLENDLQGDVADIESNSFTQALQGWEDLSQEVYQNPNWKDLFSGGSNTFINSYVQNIATQAQNYMSGVELKVEQPNNPGHYIPLYAGTSYLDGDGDIEYDPKDIDNNPDDPNYGYANPANLFEMISGQCNTLFNDSGDAYFDNSGGYGPGLWTDWSWNGHLTFNCESDGSGTDNGEYCSACGSLQDWAPFIHLIGGDPSALNAALQA